MTARCARDRAPSRAWWRGVSRAGRTVDHSGGRLYYPPMRASITGLLMLARLIGVIQLATGLAFWFGFMPDTSFHFGLGSLLVLVIWIIALIALFALPKRGVALFTLLWGGLVLWFGMTQATLLVGNLHWIIRVAHLLVGISALALVESLAKAVKVHVSARAAALLVCLGVSDVARGQTNCSDPPAQPSTIVNVPGNPFQALPTADGCWVFVSLPSTTLGWQSGIGVLQRQAGQLTLVRVLPVDGNHGNDSDAR
jgi:hypothetical protein